MNEQNNAAVPESTPAAEAQPVSTPAAPAAANKTAPAAGVSFMMAAGISAVFSAFSGFAAYQIATYQDADAGSNVVVLDSRRLIESQLDVVVKKGLPPDAAAAEGEKIANVIDAEVQKMVQSGLIVINKSVVIGAPAGVDVTDRVAASIANAAAK